MFFGSIFCFIFYFFFIKILTDIQLSTIGLSIYKFFNKKWYFDRIVNSSLGYFIIKESLFFFYLDKLFYNFSLYLTRSLSDFTLSFLNFETIAKLLEHLKLLLIVILFLFVTFFF